MLLTLFVVLNPIGAAPLFLSLTAAWKSEDRNRAARRAAIATTCVMLGALTLGGWILALFSIRIPSFRVIGGILFLLMALDMLRAKPRSARITPEEEDEATGREDIAIVPLGTPMLAGPGTISTIILWSEHAGGWIEYAILVGLIAAMGITTWLLLRLAAPMGSFLGTTGINVLTRLMGIILGALGVESMVNGLSELLPLLSRPPPIM
jgi:multiple antibiotic resistance protein